MGSRDSEPAFFFGCGLFPRFEKPGPCTLWSKFTSSPQNTFIPLFQKEKENYGRFASFFFLLGWCFGVGTSCVLRGLRCLMARSAWRFFPREWQLLSRKKKLPPRGLTRPQQERPRAPVPQGPRAPVPKGPRARAHGLGAKEEKKKRNIRPLVVANQKLAL